MSLKLSVELMPILIGLLWGLNELNVQFWGGNFQAFFADYKDNWEFSFLPRKMGIFRWAKWVYLGDQNTVSLGDVVTKRPRLLMPFKVDLKIYKILSSGIVEPDVKSHLLKETIGLSLVKCVPAACNCWFRVWNFCCFLAMQTWVVTYPLWASILL